MICDNLNSFHLKYAHPCIYVVLKILFNSIIDFGIVPEKFCLSIFTPVVKQASGQLSDVSNYRPVAIICILAKTFELLVEQQFGFLFDNHENQFGFCKGGGCSKAIFAFNSTVNYFRDKHSNVFLSALDVTKAFDRINHFSLLSCLLERGFPVQLVNVFFQWYRNMHACVSWGGNASGFFDVKSSCPEGSILEPKFFNLVVDGLLARLADSNLGCRVNSCFAGALAYADDLVLLSGSRRQLQGMLDICFDFGVECGMSFNAKKSCWD
jgi:hypothetical protein